MSKRSLFCALPPSASCCENSVIPHDVLARTLSAPPPPPPAFTWAGYYFGGQIGYGWGEDSGNAHNSGGYLSKYFNHSNVSTSTQIEGVIGGAHIGNLWQVNQFVFGLEGDVDGASLRKFTQPIYRLQYLVTTSQPIQGTFLGRVGYAFDRTLLYVTGGGGYGQIQNNYSLVGGTWSNSTTRAFWAVGGGIEYAIDTNWSVRAEYRYSNFGYFSDGPIAGTNIFQSHSWTENQVKIGFSYR
jgi:outer membrane immunogenic protein